MGFFADFIAVLKKRELVFIESRKETDEVYSFLFEKGKDLTWNPGQYGLFSITHKNVKKATRPFSLASAPVEDVVRITTVIRDNPSEFKQALLELTPGMKVKMSGPLGAFSLRDNSPSLLIAGGIGITPFRSILKQIEAEGNKGGNQIHLLYIDSGKSYVFKDELDRAANNASISVTYLDSRDDLTQETNKFIGLHKNNGKYLIAGSKSFVDSTTTYLKNNEVSKQNIMKDSFFGY
ncbi:FAD-dependent oxidoreductase [Cohnella phaseoli]|uniref:Ferredoxin-NADP reductase n=1 Tax=Cohnella phaseoli TaxID=456490 RepID=A0A3D9JTX5_9BACL|nr:FAD-dependent oxidoreductase [Cohnella phaseoli]RED77571.1 ferredoxin-NADP reductase [Cohnella phaseoli]